jgi:hypothetical protein
MYHTPVEIYTALIFVAPSQQHKTMAPQKRFKHRPRMRTAVRATPHPNGGNGYAYSHDFRQFNLFAVQAGRENDPLMEQARQLRLVPSTEFYMPRRTHPCLGTNGKKKKRDRPMILETNADFRNTKLDRMVNVSYHRTMERCV